MLVASASACRCVCVAGVWSSGALGLLGCSVAGPRRSALRTPSGRWLRLRITVARLSRPPPVGNPARSLPCCSAAPVQCSARAGLQVARIWLKMPAAGVLKAHCQGGLLALPLPACWVLHVRGPIGKCHVTGLVYRIRMGNSDPGPARPRAPAVLKWIRLHANAHGRPAVLVPPWPLPVAPRNRASAIYRSQLAVRARALSWMAPGCLEVAMGPGRGHPGAKDPPGCMGMARRSLHAALRWCVIRD